jgi:hypothetical protein
MAARRASAEVAPIASDRFVEKEIGVIAHVAICWKGFGAVTACQGLSFLSFLSLWQK